MAAKIGMPEPVRRGAKSTPLAPVDIAWLRMDEAANLMHVHGVLVLDGHVEREKVAAVLGARFAEIPRFHQRVALDRGRFVWTEDEAFDIDRHVPEERLGEPGGDAELAAAIGAHLDRPFDRAHPLWEFRLLHGYRGSDTVVFGRLHHAIGDGVALMVVLLAMTDLSPEGPAAVGSEELAAAARPGNPFFDLFTAGPGAALEAAHEAAERWMPDTLRLMLGPLEAFRKAHPLVRGLGSTAALGRMVARPSDPQSPFKGDLGIEKRVAWTRAAPLDEVKSLAKSLGGTVNDVLNTAMAGGLRRYLLRHGTPPDDLSFRAAMPVNLRPLEEMAALGNRFGLIFLSLPVGMADPMRRLEEMKERARALRHSAEPLVVLGLLGFAGRSPLAIQDLLLKIFGSKATAVFTNVPGPRKTVWFAGRPIRDIFFWVPQAGRLGLGVSIFSYAGQVRMGVGTDAGLVPDPGRIVDGFDAELEALADATARG